MKNKALPAYIVLIFVLMGVAPLFSAKAVTVYLSFAIILAGLIAIVFQKRFHRGKFVAMGFRLNRNALIGLTIGLLFTFIAIFVVVGLPCLLGLARLSLNQESADAASNVSALTSLFIILASGGLIMFVACLFGEELAFRGYILPKLEEKFGGFKAIVLCAAIFALWHLPAYFSIYSGGAAESGWGAVGLMLVAHGVSVVPICILYLTTRELYGVSLYHALMDVLQYSIIRSPELGDAAKDAVYNMTVTNEPVVTAIGWAWHGAAIFIMLGLCRIARKWTLKYSAAENTT